MNDSRLPHADSLLAHAGFVRCMARAALHGDRDVDDVVQDTWLAALQSAPRDQGALKAWLGGIARRQAANRIRRETALRRREASAARSETTAPTGDVAARVELGRRLVDAVLALKEPYRQAVLLRYYEDLPPRVIAERLGLPVETVRTHVKRGLKQLRERLDHTYADRPGGPGAAMLSILGEVSPHVLPSLLGTIGGVLVAKKTFVIAAVVVLLGGAGLWGARLFEDDPARDTGGSVLIAEEGADLAEPPGLEVRPAAKIAAVEPAAPKAEGLSGVVVERGTGRPVAGVPVYAGPRDVSLPRRAARSDEAGRFTLVGVPAGAVSIQALGAGWVSDRAWEASHGGFDPTMRTLPLAGGETLVLEVVPCAIVQGRVLNAEGEPVAGAEVEATPDFYDIRPRKPSNLRIVVTDAAGRFTHDALMPHRRCRFEARSPDHPSTRVPVMDLVPGTENRELTIQFVAGQQFDVVVTDAATGAGLPGAQVWATWFDVGHSATIRREWRTDAQGRAAVGSVPRAPVRIDVRCLGYGAPREPVWVEAPGAAESVPAVEVQLDLGLSIRGRVNVPASLDVARARVQAERRSGTHTGSAEFRVDADGTFEITGIAAGEYRIHATLYIEPDWYVGTAMAAAPGSGVVIELKHGNGPFPEEPTAIKRNMTEVSLRVLSPSGKPLRRGWIHFRDAVAMDAVDLEDGPARIHVVADGEGVRFRCTDLGGDEEGQPFAAGTYGPIRPRGGVLTLPIRHGVSIDGTVTTEAGAGLVGVRVAAFEPSTDPRADPEGSVAVASTDEAGRFSLTGLLPGPYLLKLDVPSSMLQPQAVLARAGGPAVRVELRTPERAVMTVRDDMGRPLAGALVSVRPLAAPHPAFEDHVFDRRTDAAGRATVERIERGALYALLVFPPDGHERTLLIYDDSAWRAGPCEIQLEAGVFTAGVAHDSHGRPVPKAAVYYWEDGAREHGTVIADALGRFRFGPTRAGTLRVSAMPRLLPTAPDPLGSMDVEAGGQDLVVTVQP